MDNDTTQVDTTQFDTTLNDIPLLDLIRILNDEEERDELESKIFDIKQYADMVEERKSLAEDIQPFINTYNDNKTIENLYAVYTAFNEHYVKYYISDMGIYGIDKEAMYEWIYEELDYLYDGSPLALELHNKLKL